MSATGTPRANPASTGTTAKADLSALGGSATATLNSLGNNLFSATVPVPPGTTLGIKLVTVTFTDAEGRTWEETQAINVQAQSVPALPPWGLLLLAVLMFGLMTRAISRKVAVNSLGMAVFAWFIMLVMAKAEDFPMWESFIPDAIRPLEAVETSSGQGNTDPNALVALHTATQGTGLQSLASLSVPASFDAEVAALAEAIGNGQTVTGEAARAKADRLSSWVRHQIDYEHYYGLRKGAALTLLENAGDDLDQCALLMDLLVAAGYSSTDVKLLKKGQAINYTQLVDWMGLSSTPYPGQTYQQVYGRTIAQDFGAASSGVSDEVAKQTVFAIDFLNSRGSRLGSGGVAYDPSYLPSKATLVFDRFFVVLTVGGQSITYDPSYKLYQKITATANLASLSGYSRTSLLTAAGGTTDGTSFAHSLQESNIGTYLTGLTATLQSQLNGALNQYTIADLVNGRKIINPQISDATSLSYGTSVMYNSVNDSGLTAFKSTVNYLSGTLDYTLPIADLKGRKVTLNFVGNSAQLRLDDGTPVATTTVTGATLDLKVTVSHPGNLRSRFINMRCKKNDAYMYVLPYGFTPSGRLIQKRQEQLQAYRDAGKLDDSREVRTETLNIIGLTWLYQSELCYRLLASQNGILYLNQHILGRTAQEEGYYVDFGLVTKYTTPNDSIPNPAVASSRYDNVFHLGSLFASAMEHGVIEQMQPGSTAISTVNIIARANSTANPIFLAKQSNWQTGPNVRSQLASNGYSSSLLSSLDPLISDATSPASLLIPKTYSVTQGSWTGSGWVSRSYNTAGMVINGAYAGGFSTTKTNVVSAPVTTNYTASPATNYSNSSFSNNIVASSFQPATGNYASDPVDMGTGGFVYAANDITVGAEESPRGLSFSRYYSSNSSTADSQNLAYGWSHNLYIRANVRTTLEEAVGQASIKFAAPFLVAITAASDLYRSDASPKEWVAAALSVKWAVDQLKDNAVSVRVGKDVFQFIRQPDGSYLQPAGTTLSLTKAGDSTYRFTQQLGNTIEFNTDNKASRIVDVDGKAMTFVYYANNDATKPGFLNYVEDAAARRFTFGYTGTRITSIADSSTTNPATTARSVSFGYDTTNGNLTSATDPEGKKTNFDYNVTTAPADPSGTTADQHRIVRLSNNNNEIITQNVYDSLGRVYQQYLHGDTAKTFKLYYTGSDNYEVNPQGGATHYFYDERGRSTGQSDPNGNTTRLTYDAQDRVATRISATSEVTRYFYFPSNNLRQVDHPRGGGSTFLTYDSLNRLDLVTDAAGYVTDYDYFSSGNDAGKDRPQTVKSAKGTADESTTTFAYYQSGAAVGRVNTITDGDNLTTTKYYDANGLPDTTVYPGGFTSNADYDNRCNLYSMLDAKGIRTNYTYNQRREQTSEVADTASVNATTDIGYDNMARVATQTAPSHNGSQRVQTSFTYSPTDKVRLQKLNTVTMADTAYDSRDWTANVKDAANRQTTYLRKANGDLQENQAPGNRTTKFVYDSDSRLTSSTNPGANSGLRTANFVYATTTGNLPRTTETQADGRTETSEFDPLGRLRFLRDRKGNAFEMRYDGLDRRTHVINPLTQATVTSYKKNGRVDKITEPSNDTATFAYNPTTGRASSITYAGAGGGGVVNFTSYDNNGNVLALNENGTGGISRLYDGLNRVTSYTAGGNTIGYRYYANGQLYKLIYPGGSETGIGHVEYTYDANGRLKDVIDRLDSTSSPRTTSYDWRTDGRLNTITRPNGTVRTIGYDSVGRPQSITETKSGTTLLSWGVTYWPSDDIKTLNLTPALSPTLLTPAPTAAMTFNAANQLASWNGTNVSNDSDGNLTNGPIPATGAIGTFTYDSRNRLTSAGGLTYTYNAEGQRIGIAGTETTSLVVDPNGAMSKILSRTKNGITTRYVYGAGLQYEVSSPGVATYYHYDQAGNTAALSNASGTLIERVAYSPYGTIRYRQSNFDTPFLFGGFFGVMTDTNGLLQMRARYYNPRTLRFMNADPAMDGWNWYAYANGNPVNWADPTGFGGSKVLDAVKTGLSFLGFLPVVGVAADLANAGISLAQGRYGEAALNAFSAIPGIGDAAAAGKLAFTGVAISRAVHGAEVAFTAAKVEGAVVKSAGQLGREGEAAVRASYDIGDKAKFLINGRTRIPDGVNEIAKTISEVKNTASQSFTQQLKDTAALAQQEGFKAQLFTRPGANLSGPLKQAIEQLQFNRFDIP